MIEFGSDFHRCEDVYKKDKEYDFQLPEMRLYANGRQSLSVILTQEKYKRIWVPAYFCFDVFDYLKNLGIQVLLYDDCPLCDNDDIIVRNLPYEDGDVLLRINYFGLRGFRSNRNIPVPVIEDHSHDFMSEWAILSDADWCVASLRKSFPIALGGALWSSKHVLPNPVRITEECSDIASIRNEAMLEKRKYIDGKIENKVFFRNGYVQSEDRLVHMTLSKIDDRSNDIFNSIDISLWTESRYANWKVAVSKLSTKFNILRPKDEYKRIPFSLIILCSSEDERNSLRQFLITNNIFPAILWNIPDNVPFKHVKEFSKRMLSIHCDGRYSNDDIEQMCNIILKYD